MTTLPWNKEIIEWFTTHRIDWLTQIFVFFTFLGNELGYILLVAAIYWLFNKKIGVRLVIAVVLTSLINHSLKIIIRNPRPYVSEGTYHENWAIPEGDIEETVHSFSTPSGHAQGSSTFWLYLHLKAKSRLTFILFPIMILFIGLSRPYLGVHYLEDIILGWIIGFVIVIFLHRYDDRVATWWSTQSFQRKLLLILSISLTVSILAGILSGFGIDGEQYVTLSAIFAGIMIGSVLDEEYIQYDPNLKNFDKITTQIFIAILRLLLGLVIIAVFLFGLSALFDLLAEDLTPLGFLLRWVRYTSVGIAGLVLVPMMFKKFKLS